MEKLSAFFQNNPQYGGSIPAVFGLLLIVAVVRDWDWVLEGGTGRMYSIAAFSNQFGRKAARILVGCIGGFLILIGIVWSLLYLLF